MLDITVTKRQDRNTGCWSWALKPFTKPTSIACYLDPTSAHPSHVHRVWPRALLLRRLLTTSGYCDRVVAKADIIARFAKFHANHDTLQRLEENLHTPFGNLGPRTRTAPTSSVHWIGLPFHPAMA